MIRQFLLRVVLPLAVFLILRAVIKSFFAKPRTAVTPSQSPAGGELKKDPVCGTYVSEGAAVTRVVKGATLHFCSTACRDKYPTKPGQA